MSCCRPKRDKDAGRVVVDQSFKTKSMSMSFPSVNRSMSDDEATGGFDVQINLFDKRSELLAKAFNGGAVPANRTVASGYTGTFVVLLLSGSCLVVW